MGLHWIEGEDSRGFATWERYVECSHWGLFYTWTAPQWQLPSVTAHFEKVKIS